MAYHRTLLDLDPIIGLCIESELIKTLLPVCPRVPLFSQSGPWPPLHPVLRMNVDRPCLLGTKMGTLIFGLFFSLGPISGLGLFSKEASQAGDLWAKLCGFYIWNWSEKGGQ